MVWVSAAAAPLLGRCWPCGFPRASVPHPAASRAERRWISREALRAGLGLSLAIVGYAAMAAFLVLHLDEHEVGHVAAMFAAFAASVVGCGWSAGAARPLRVDPVRDRRGPGRSRGTAGDRRRAVVPVAVIGAVAMGAGFSLLFPSLALLVVNRCGGAPRRGDRNVTAFFDLGWASAAPWWARRRRSGARGRVRARRGLRAGGHGGRAGPAFVVANRSPPRRERARPTAHPAHCLDISYTSDSYGYSNLLPRHPAPRGRSALTDRLGLPGGPGETEVGTAIGAAQAEPSPGLCHPADTPTMLRATQNQVHIYSQYAARRKLRGTDAVRGDSLAIDFTAFMDPSLGSQSPDSSLRIGTPATRRGPSAAGQCGDHRPCLAKAPAQLPVRAGAAHRDGLEDGADRDDDPVGDHRLVFSIRSAASGRAAVSSRSPSPAGTSRRDAHPGWVRNLS